MEQWIIGSSVRSRLFGIFFLMLAEEPVSSIPSRGHHAVGGLAIGAGQMQFVIGSDRGLGRGRFSAICPGYFVASMIGRQRFLVS